MKEYFFNSYMQRKIKYLFPASFPSKTLPFIHFQSLKNRHSKTLISCLFLPFLPPNLHFLLKNQSQFFHALSLSNSHFLSVPEDLSYIQTSQSNIFFFPFFPSNSYIFPRPTIIKSTFENCSQSFFFLLSFHQSHTSLFPII